MSDFWAIGAPTLLTGAGTLALAGVTVRLMRRESDDRARLQAIEDERIERERMTQALGISAFYAGEGRNEAAVGSRVVVINHSEGPAFGVVISLVFIQGAGPRTGADVGRFPDLRLSMNVLPPGEWHVWFPSNWHGMNAMVGAEVAFSDSAGRHWIRRATGEICAIPRPAEEYFALPRPHGYVFPQPWS